MMTPLSPDYQARCNNAAVAVLDDRGIGFENRNGVFHVSDLPAAQAVIDDVAAQIAKAQEMRFADLAERRWQAETGGFQFGALRVGSDDRSKVMIEGARKKAEADPSYTVRWKIAPGQFATLDAPTIIAASDAMLAHVQSCFDLEDERTTAITGLTDPVAVLGFDIEAGWPA